MVQFTQVVFAALQALFLSLIRKHLIYSHEVEQWYIGALGLITGKVRYFQERRLIFKGGHLRSILLFLGRVVCEIGFLAVRSRLAITQ